MKPETINNARPTMDLTLICAAVVVITLIVLGLTAFPTQAEAVAQRLFTEATVTFGSIVQVLGFACVIVVIGLAFSKYGNIRLGEGRPEYSNTSWVFMFICAGLGSATMYWAFMEWGYYYMTPGLGITAASKEALEMSVAYSFFHWGITPWSIYGIAS
ncbi:MAG: BCCT family transporter, partial [Pseudomonas sp.]